MQFNGATDDQDLCTLADDYANTTDLQFPLAKKARYANKTVKAIRKWIFKAYGGWQYDDASNTTLPIATTTLKQGQSDYDIPLVTKAIRGVEILPTTTSTVYQPLKLITEEEIRDMGFAEGSFQSTQTGVPKYYRPIGWSIKVYPASNSEDVANGFRVTLDRGDTEFTSTSTTETPGFDSDYHEAVGVGMALEWAKQNHLSNASDLQKDFDNYRDTIMKDYSMRLAQKYPARITTRDETSNYI